MGFPLIIFVFLLLVTRLELFDSHSSDSGSASFGSFSEPPSTTAPPEKSKVIKKNKSIQSKMSITQSSTSTQNTLNQDKLKNLLTRLDSSSPWRIAQEGGLVHRISGGNITGFVTPDEQLKLAQEIANALGIQQKQVILSPRMMPSTSLSKATEFMQVIEGYPVLGAYMKFSIHSKNHSIYFITNSMIPIDHVQTGPSILPFENCHPPLDHHFKEQPWTLQSSPKLVWYPSSSGTAQLIYWTHVQFLSRTHDLFINSSDCQILRDQIADLH